MIIRFITFLYIDERREGDHQSREVVEIRRKRKSAAVILVEERKPRGVEGMIERSVLIDQEEMATETMVKGERDKNDEDRTVTTEEDKTGRGNAMTGEKRTILV
jgi:hypothetical protein